MSSSVAPEHSPKALAAGQSSKRRFLNAPFLITLIVCAVVLAALAAFKLIVVPSIIKGVLAKNIPPPPTVTSDKAAKQQWTPRLRSVGTLTAIQGIDVAPQVAGVVSKIYFESGRDVKAGDRLVDLDTNVEVADLAAGEAALKQADADLARQNDLSRRAIASEATQQAAQAKRDSAAATVERVRALITQKQVVAAFSGRAGIRKIELGQYLAAGTAIVALQQLDPIRVDFPVTEGDVARLRVGQSIEATVDAHPGTVFKGEIKSLDSRLSTDSRTLLARAEIANADGKLLPGMFAKVDVLTGSPVDQITVPRTAITYSLYGDSVYVVLPAPAPADGASGTPPAPPAEPALIVERRFVRISDTLDDRVAISEGLKAGDQIVTTGQLKLQNGGKVRVDNTKQLTPPAERPRI